MDFYLGLAQIVGVHTLLGLSAYCVLLTGQVSLAQAGFFAIGAYVAAMLTVLAGWHIAPAIAAASFVAGATACAIGFPALRVKGLMLVVATLAFGEAVRSEEHTSELQSQSNLVCRLLLEKKKKQHHQLTRITTINRKNKTK